MSGRPVKRAQGHFELAFGAAAFFFVVGIGVRIRVLSFWILERWLGRDEVQLWAPLSCFLIGMVWAGVGLHWWRKRRRDAKAASAGEKP